MLRLPKEFTAPPNVMALAVTLVLPLKMTGPSKLKAPLLVTSPSMVVVPVLMICHSWFSSPVVTGLAKCKLPAPLLRVASASKLMLLPTRPKKRAWSVVRKVPAKPMVLGVLATNPPTKFNSSDATLPNCK